MNTKTLETSLKTTSTIDEINHDYRLYIQNIYRALKTMFCGELILIEQDKKVLFSLGGRQLGWTERTSKEGKIYFKSVFNKDIELS